MKKLLISIFSVILISIIGFLFLRNWSLRVELINYDLTGLSAVVSLDGKRITFPVKLLSVFRMK